MNNSYNIAKECMEKAYNEVRANISPKFAKKLCEIISKISNNRYKNIVLSDDDGLKVEIENGSYVPVSRLSVGTIDQMYLSLRLSALAEITKETMPIILDGEIQNITLNEIDKDEKWIRKILNNKKIKLEDVFYAF